MENVAHSLQDEMCGQVFDFRNDVGLLKLKMISFLLHANVMANNLLWDLLRLMMSN